MRYSSVEQQYNAQNLLKNVRSHPFVGVIYRGRVIRNDDPSGVGRVKIHIPSLYTFETDSEGNVVEDDVPWALPCMAMASYNAGSFIIPQVGDYVWVLFESNDIYKPVYIGFLYSTGASQNLPVGSGIAPANSNYVPTEAVNPSHYVIMKTPQGSGMWMNDERGTAHMYSANGGQMDLEEDRASMAYATGGSFTSMEGRAVMFSPSEATVDIDDETESIIISRHEDLKILMKENKGITIHYKGESDNEINLSESKIVISRNKDEQTVVLDDGYIKLDYKDNYIKIEDGKITISAKSVIELDAPTVIIP